MFGVMLPRCLHRCSWCFPPFLGSLRLSRTKSEPVKKGAHERKGLLIVISRKGQQQQTAEFHGDFLMVRQRVCTAVGRITTHVCSIRAPGNKKEGRPFSSIGKSQLRGQRRNFLAAWRIHTTAFDAVEITAIQAGAARKFFLTEARTHAKLA